MRHANVTWVAMNDTGKGVATHTLGDGHSRSQVSFHEHLDEGLSLLEPFVGDAFGSKGQKDDKYHVAFFSVGPLSFFAVVVWRSSFFQVQSSRLIVPRHAFISPALT